MPTTQLSGLELRKQVALKLGWRVGPTKNFSGQTAAKVLTDKYREGIAYDLLPPKDPGEEVQWWFASEELAWQSCPAFERDLGALQSAGVIDEIADKIYYIQRDRAYLDWYGNPSQWGIYTEDMDHTEPDKMEQWGAGDNEGPRGKSEALATAISRAFLNLSSDK